MFFETLVVTFLTLVVAWVYFSQRRPKDFPPGPMGIPIFGYLPFMGATPHKKLGELAKRYGDIFSVHYGKYPIVVLNSLPIIKEAFRQDIFSGRPNHLLAMELSRDGITFNDGMAGYEQRRFTLKTLKDFGFGKQAMEKLVEEEVREVVSYFGKNLGKPVEIKHIFGTFVINALWSILAGDRFNVHDSRIQDLYRLCIEGFIDPEVAGALWFLPWLAKIMPERSGYNKVRQAVSELRALMKSVVEEHKKTYQPGIYRDFIDVYLERIKKEDDPISSFYGEVGENNLAHVLIDLFTAGSDTLNSSLNFAILYLCNNRHIMDRVQMEIDSVVGKSRFPDTEDRKNMPYTEAVICEVLRRSSIVVGAILHSTTEDAKLGAYFLPKGTIVMANLYEVHHSEATWGDPDVFRPERFLSEETFPSTVKTRTRGKLNFQEDIGNTNVTFVRNENLVPFSVGKRVCLAEQMAQTEFFMFLAGILQNFEIRFADEGNIPSMDDVNSGLVLSPTPFRVVFTERV